MAKAYSLDLSDVFELLEIEEYKRTAAFNTIS